jgi:sporulation protein YlmC with PRC-barrel domain
MTKLLIGLSTAALLAATPAFAQTTHSPTKQESTQNKAATGVNATRTNPAASKPKMVEAKGRFRVSKLVGASVINTKNESIGDINDLVIGSDGRVDQVIVGVGGFLGLGERNVALKFRELDMKMNTNGSLVVATDLSKTQLEELPAWKMDDAK